MSISFITSTILSRCQRFDFKKISTKQICEHLGMELDEVIRLRQVSGLKEAFANHTFSKSWEEFERNLEN